LQQETQWVELQERKRALQALRRRDFWRRLRKWSGLVNNWTWAVLLVLGSFGAGILVGVNVLPAGVLCPGEQSPCYWLRWDGNKAAR
jgi:hypothetical protein